MIKVLHPGFYTSIQDFGRVGYEAYGVPISGVMDKNAAAFANAILGNDIQLPVLEITMQGPKLRFECETVICISGADLSPKLNGKTIANHKPISILKGEVLSFGTLKSGFRAYLGVLDGFKSIQILKSYSMYQGITPSFRLQKGDALHIATEQKTIKKQFASVKFNDTYFKSIAIEVMKGAEFDMLSNAQQYELLNNNFSISKDNNRMAYQLNETIKNSLPQILTSLVLPGTVQLTPSGQLIILMRDCQTTGGYPRVLQLTEISINQLSQKFMGEKVNFRLKS
ncbi:biotin-dependent carboxyltransferase family protein [Flavobacteriaceae bacterium MHTCC 0001]